MTFEEYQAMDGLNISALLHMLKSPAYYQHRREHDGKRTDALRVGNAIHCATLEPDTYVHRYAVWSGADRRTKAGKAAWEAFIDGLDGRAHVTQEEHETAWNISHAVNTHPTAGEYVRANGTYEETVAWMHPLGVACKSRLDRRLTDLDVVLDLKSTIDAGPDSFGRSAAKYNYHARMAFYLDAVQIAHGRRCRAVFIAAEKQPPYQVAVYSLPDDAIQAGRELYTRLLVDLLQCQESGEWPGIEMDQETELHLPPWAFGAGGGSVELQIGDEAVRL